MVHCLLLVADFSYETSPSSAGLLLKPEDEREWPSVSVGNVWLLLGRKEETQAIHAHSSSGRIGTVIIC